MAGDIPWGKILIGAAAALAAAAVVYSVVRLVVITLEAVIAWFRSRSATLQADRDRLAVTVAESFATGNAVVYRGIFNRRVNSFEELEKVVGERVDPDIAAAHHRHGEAVAWTI